MQNLRILIGEFIAKHKNWFFPLAFSLMFIPGPFIFSDWRNAVIAGIIITFIGQTIRFITIGLDFEVKGEKHKNLYSDKIMKQGLYAHTRNPLHIGNMIMIAGMSILSNNLLYLIIMLPFFFLVFESIIKAEEKFLKEKFGKDYLAYQSQVPRWFPKFSGLLTLVKAPCNTIELLFREYKTCFVWSTSAILLIATHIFRNEGVLTFQENATGLFIAIGLLFVVFTFVNFYKVKDGYHTD